MIRKLVVILLATIMCFSGIIPVLGQELRIWSSLGEYEADTGKKIEKFDEAPMLRMMVAAGKLPPVEQRLPEEPFVVQAPEIGQYGGTIDGVVTAVMTWEDVTQFRLERPDSLTLDLGKLIPGYVKAYEYSEDLKTFTVHMRKGMKWSDGSPFTSDDFLFWYEDILQNEELTPVIDALYKPGGELMEMEIVDEYTFRVHFAAPCPRLIGRFVPWMKGPKSYLKKWHIRYNLKADGLAKEEGFDYWWQAFNFHSDYYGLQNDPDSPSLYPWVLKERTPTLEIFERNPYYWKVDTAGNQLPYTDELVANITGNIEALNLKVIAGEIDFVAVGLSLENYTLYKEGEEKGDYRTLLWKSTDAADPAFAFNLNHKDPVLREIFQDVRFRRAMSLAINRDEMNEIVYEGRGTPCQATVLPSASYYKEEWGRAYAQYDPEEANRLLDEVGLEWDSAHKWRLRPDGKTLAITMEFYPMVGTWTTNCELVREYWNAVGMKVTLKQSEWSYYETRAHAGELDVGVWGMGRNTENLVYIVEGYMFNVYYGGWELGAWTQWAAWVNTEGKEGEEPPEEVKELHRWLKAWAVAATDEEYRQLAQKIFDFHAENLWIIGTVGMAKMPVIVKDNLGNVPEVAYLGEAASHWQSAQPTAWFFRK